MKYALHRRNEDDSLGEMIGEMLDTKEEVEIFMVEGTRKGEISPMKPDGYSIETYDDAGNLVELVSEEEAQKAADQATRLVEVNQDIASAVGTIIASRQLYTVCINELERLLEKVDKREEVHPLTIEVLIQTAAHQAGVEFSEIDLFEGLNSTAMPWLQKVVARHVRDDAAAETAAINVQEEERRKIKIDLGVTLNSGVPTTIKRSQTVVFVGYRPALKIIMDHVLNTIMTTRVNEYPGVFTVIRFADDMNPDGSHPRMVRAPRAAWENCARNSKSVAICMGKHVIDELKRNPDVLMVDDMPHAYKGIKGSQMTTNAAEAMRRFKQWTSKAGCALVCGIALPTEEAPALIGTQWDRLKTHATVRPVTLLRKADDLEEGKCRILVGRNAFTLDVDEKLLRGKLILPGD